MKNIWITIFCDGKLFCLKKGNSEKKKNSEKSVVMKKLNTPYMKLPFQIVT